MTDMTITHLPEGGLLRRLWHSLQLRRLRRAQMAHLDMLSDRMLADIGLECDRVEIRTLHTAMRFSG